MLAWVKNTGLGLSIRYNHTGEAHDYLADFIVRLGRDEYLLLETKGHDELKDVKKAAAERWCSAVNAGGRWGTWTYRIAYNVGDVGEYLLPSPV